MFNLTRQEKFVLIFVACIFFIGLGLNFALKHAPWLNNVYYHFQVIDKLDLNKANYEELVNLPQIGETLAKNIIDYRTTYGFFKNLEELRQIKGIS
ncbi:MAG: helix-hairpin-helix domain-containing protein, partial [Candidatus Omnitrophota bacterium]